MALTSPKSTYSQGLSLPSPLTPISTMACGQMGCSLLGWLLSLDRTWWASTESPVVITTLQTLRSGTGGDKVDPVNSMGDWVVCNVSKNGLMWNRIGKIKSLRQMVWSGWNGMC